MKKQLTPPFRAGIYAILDQGDLPTLLNLGGRLLRLNVSAIQIRAKSLTPAERGELTRQLLQEAGLVHYEGSLILNDDLFLASELKMNLHVGQEDLQPTPFDALRARLPEQLIGISTHSLEEALLAEEMGADYIGFGPMFPTTSKVNPLSPRSPALFAEVIRRIHIPVVAIGGITPSNFQILHRLGGRHFALLSALHQVNLDDREIVALQRRMES